MSSNVTNTGGINSSSSPTPPPVDPNAQLFEQVALLLQQFQAKEESDKAHNKIASDTAVVSTQTDNFVVFNPSENTNTSTDVINLNATMPTLTPPAPGAPPLPVPGANGTAAIWLKPSLTGILFMILFAANQKLMQNKLAQGLRSAQYIIESGTLAVQEGQAILAKAAVEATQHIVSAALAFGTAAVQVYSAGRSIGAKRQATRETENETAKLKDNPECNVDGYNNQKGLKKSVTDLPVEGEGDVERYFRNKRDIENGIDPTTGKQIKGNPFKSVDDKKSDLLEKNDEIKPGAKQLEKWFNKNQDDTDPIYQSAKKEQTDTLTEINERETNPKYVAQKIDEKRQDIMQYSHSIADSTQNILRTIDEVYKAVAKTQEAGFEQQQRLIQNTQGNIRTLMETAQNARRETGDTLSDFIKWLIQYSETNTRVFSFRK